MWHVHQSLGTWPSLFVCFKKRQTLHAMAKVVSQEKHFKWLSSCSDTTCTVRSCGILELNLLHLRIDSDEERFLVLR
jgi:L-rhamnose mutarotase